MKKRSKILAAAIALLGFSTAASITGTVAWFTANNVVSVSGMQIQADVEEGLVIANETHTADSHWATEATASHNGENAKLIPTSTSDLESWYHGLSAKADDGQYKVDYDAFNTPADSNSDGVYTATADRHFPTSGADIYLLNKFYLQASAQTVLVNRDIFVKDLVITGASTSAALDKSLRVGFAYRVKASEGGEYGAFSGAKVFAPVTGADASYQITPAVYSETSTYAVGEYVTQSSTAYRCTTAVTTAGAFDSSKWQAVTFDSVTAVTSTSGDGEKLIDNTSLYKYTTAGTNAIEVYVFVYFEGEDENHKSANITETLDTLHLSFKLNCKNHSA